MSTDKLIAEISQIRNLIVNESKRAIKKQVPKTPAVRNEIRDNLVTLYNRFTNVLALHWLTLDDLRKHQVKQIFVQVRDKIIQAFLFLDVKYKIPSSPIENINSRILNEEEDLKEDETMALSVTEFFNLASKLVPTQFDGTHSNLQSFLDALSLLHANSEGNDEREIAFIKTRLTGKARDLVSDDMSFDEILESLKANIKGESSKMLTSKLMSAKQGHKDTSIFSKEIDSLAHALQKAYITEGVPHTVAQTYATDATIKALTKNAASEKTRLVMEAGTFKTIDEAITKLVSITSEPTEKPNIFYSKQVRNKRYNNYQSYRNNKSSPFISNRHKRRNFQQNHNYQHKYNHNNKREQYVRTCEQSNFSGNVLSPRRNVVGEN